MSNQNYGTAVDDNKPNSQNSEETDNFVGDSSVPRPHRKWFLMGQNVLYGLGHVYNDLCAAMWFSYMMLFFQAVLNMRAAVSGILLFLGQVIDALATPVVGVLADKISTKKNWHLSGCFLVTCTFPLMFIRCWGCRPGPTDSTSYLSWWIPVYYAVLIVFFQIGWAIVQISHLAMIPDISESMQVRSELTSIRYMASVTSSITMYFITWTVLRATNYSSYIGPTDDYKFRDVSIIVTALGVTSYAFFHLFFSLKRDGPKNKDVPNEKSQTLPTTNEETSERKLKTFNILQFFRMPLLYQASLLYVFSRLYWALSLVYVPLFLDERLTFNPSSGSELVATVPLVLYVSSFFTSLILKSKISSCGTQISYLLGSCLSLISCMWLAFAVGPEADTNQIYLVAALIGAGSSMTLIASLCITADLIGPHTNHGASVYSIVTFADKLVTGLVVVAIEYYKCETQSDCPQYYRGVLTYACGGSVLLGILSLAVAKINCICGIMK